MVKLSVFLEKECSIERGENNCMKIDEQTGLYGNYDIWHKPFWQTITFYRISGLLLFTSMLLLGYLLIKKYRVRKKKKKVPAWQHALQELKLLQKNNKVVPVHGKEFYRIVTAIFKSYLQEQFNSNLCSKTDTEVISYLEKRVDIDPELLQIIRTIFKGSVLIKFANERAIQEQIEHDFNQSVMIIKKTMQQEKERDNAV